MSRISVRGLAVASATAVTTVGAVVGAAAGADQGGSSDDNNVEATAADATLIADIPAGQHSSVQTAALTRQADTMSDAAQADARKAAEESARKKAAADAEAKKEAAEKKAAAEKEAKEHAQQAASRSAERTDIPVQSSYSTAQVQSMARSMVPSGQFQCFSNIVSRESGWNYKAVNASSGAYGLFQALPGSKMASAGSDWQTNPQTQIKWGLNYMNSRYGSPCEAWSFWQANNWY